MNDWIENFASTATADGTIGTANNVGTIPGGSSRNVMFSPLSGLLNQSKYIPIRYCPITFEIEIVGSYTDAIVEGATDGAQASNTTNTSATWDISNVQMKRYVISLGNGLDNE